MKILSITAQKPNSTGSGVYLTELVKEFAEMGHAQAVVAGVYGDDQVELPEGVSFYPVVFDSPKLPYPIAGMSDEMPYKSTRYRDMTPEMTEQFKRAFLQVITRAVEELEPDIILCHHLYLLTAVVRENFPGYLVYGFCHNTDLRQMVKHDLEREYIREQVRCLDHIFVPQSAQETGVKEIYQVPQEKITRLGMGYNSEIFCRNRSGKCSEERNEASDCGGKCGEERNEASDRGGKCSENRNEASDCGDTVQIVFAGKIAEKKGVISLLRAMKLLEGYLEGKKQVKLFLAGSTGNEEEYALIRSLAEECPYEVEFPGRLSQTDLAKVYNQCDIFALPSFFEGIPLTVIEALACGCRVVMTDLPGIADWLSETVPGADVRYVKMPGMRNADEPVAEELPAFEERLAQALAASIMQKEMKYADVSAVSWKGISERVLEELRCEIENE